MYIHTLLGQTISPPQPYITSAARWVPIFLLNVLPEFSL